MAVTYAQIVGELLDSRQAEAAAAKQFYDHWNRGYCMLSESQRHAVIELSAQGLSPKPIAEQLNLGVKQVSNVRTAWKGAIDARRNELQGRRPDGTVVGPVAMQAERDEDIAAQEELPAAIPDAAHRLAVQSVEIAGEFGQYRLTPERVHILGCEIQLIDCDKLPALIADLTAINAMLSRGTAWNL